MILHTSHFPFVFSIVFATHFAVDFLRDEVGRFTTSGAFGMMFCLSADGDFFAILREFYLYLPLFVERMMYTAEFQFGP